MGIIRRWAKLPSPLPGQRGAAALGADGALHQLMAVLSAAERDEIWQEIESELCRLEEAGGFSGPCEMLVGAASK